MALSYKREIGILNLSKDADLEEILLQRRKFSQLLTFNDAVTHRLMSLDNAEGAVALSFQRLTQAELLYIESSGDLDVAINGAAALQLRPAAGKMGFLLIETCIVTSLSVTNPNAGAIVDVFVSLAGS
jgi:hypothetical protein